MKSTPYYSRITRSSIVASTLLLASGCGSSEGPAPPPEVPPIAEFNADPCAHLLGSESGLGQVDQLSSLYADARWFMVGAGQVPAGRAMSVASDLGESAVDDFASDLGGCSRLPRAELNTPIKVTLDGAIAIIEPGEGAFEIPANATHVAIDLRNGRGRAENAAKIRDLLDQIGAARVALDLTMVEGNGMPDEIFTVGSEALGAAYYGLAPKLNHDLPNKDPGAATRSVSFLTDARISPEVTRLVLATRLAGGASIFGENLVSAVGEFHVVGSGALKTAQISVGHMAAPEVILADARTSQPLVELKRHATDALPSAISLDTAVQAPWAKTAPVPLGVARAYDPSARSGRTELLEAYAAFRAFSPYFELEPTSHQDSLRRALMELGNVPTSSDIRGAIGTLISSWKDGHSWAMGIDPKDPARKSFAAEVEFLDDSPRVMVARNSGALNAGDEILSFNGVSMDSLFKVATGHTSAGYRRRLVEGAVSDAFVGPTADLQVRAIDGQTRLVSTTTSQTERVLFTNWTRPSGPLTDLGRNDVFYINLNTTQSDATSDQTVALAQKSKAVIFDMRGYPSLHSSEIVGKFLSKTTPGIRYVTRKFSAVEKTVVGNEIQTVGDFGGSLDSPYSGKMFLLIDTATQSYAETLTAFFVGAGVTIIGRSSSGAEGNIAGLWLSAGHSVSFTGMECTLATGKILQGVGIQPDIAMERPATDIAVDKDTFLHRALDSVPAPY